MSENIFIGNKLLELAELVITAGVGMLAYGLLCCAFKVSFKNNS